MNIILLYNIILYYIILFYIILYYLFIFHCFYPFLPYHPDNYANTSALVMPCIGCPLISKCYPGNLVEPATCLYMKEWLSMDMSNALTPTQEYSLLSSELATLHRARVTSTTDNTTTGTTTTMQ